MIEKFAPPRLVRALGAPANRRLAAAITVGVLAVSLGVVAFLKHPVRLPVLTAQDCNVAFTRQKTAHLQGYARYYECATASANAVSRTQSDTAACQPIRREADLILSNATADLLNCYRMAAAVGNSTPPRRFGSLATRQLAMSVLETNLAPPEPSAGSTSNPGRMVAARLASPSHARPSKHGRRLASIVSHLVSEMKTVSPQGLGPHGVHGRPSQDTTEPSSSIYSSIMLERHWPPLQVRETTVSSLDPLLVADEISGARSLPAVIDITMQTVDADAQKNFASPNDEEINLTSSNALTSEDRLFSLGETVQTLDSPVAPAESESKETPPVQTQNRLTPNDEGHSNLLLKTKSASDAPLPSSMATLELMSGQIEQNNLDAAKAFNFEISSLIILKLEKLSELRPLNSINGKFKPEFMHRSALLIGRYFYLNAHQSPSLYLNCASIFNKFRMAYNRFGLAIIEPLPKQSLLA